MPQRFANRGRSTALFLLMLITSAIASPAYPRQQLPNVPGADTVSDQREGLSATAGSSLDTMRLALERERLELERERLEEQHRVSQQGMIAVIVTAVLGFGTILYNLRNAHYQARVQARLKATEIVISAAGPESARERLNVVKQLLGGDLIPQKLGDNLVAHGIGQGHDQNRKDLIKMLVEHPNEQEKVIALWRVAFGTTKLKNNLNEMAAALGLSQATQGGNAPNGEGSSLPDPHAVNSTANTPPTEFPGDNNA